MGKLVSFDAIAVKVGVGAEEKTIYLPEIEGIMLTDGPISRVTRVTSQPVSPSPKYSASTRRSPPVEEKAKVPRRDSVSGLYLEGMYLGARFDESEMNLHSGAVSLAYRFLDPLGYFPTDVSNSSLSFDFRLGASAGYLAFGIPEFDEDDESLEYKRSSAFRGGPFASFGLAFMNFTRTSGQALDGWGVTGGMNVAYALVSGDEFDVAGAAFLGEGLVFTPYLALEFAEYNARAGSYQSWTIAASLFPDEATALLLGVGRDL